MYVFFNFIILLFSKDALNQSKVIVKTFRMLQKISILNKPCSFELSKGSLKDRENGVHTKIKQHICFQH